MKNHYSAFKRLIYHRSYQSKHMTETEGTKIKDIESKIENIESRTNHLESDVYKTEDGILKLSEDLNIWRLFNERMIPIVYEKNLLKLLEKLDEKSYIEAVNIFPKSLFWFSWDDFPENDNNRFIVYIAKKYNIKGLTPTQIEKNDKEKTIKICFENNFISLRLYEENDKVYLKINDQIPNEFVLMQEKEGLNIYKTLDFDIPHPLRKKNCNKKRILKSTTFLKNAKEFFEAGKIASSDTKPIFYYYSITFLFSFLLDSLVDFENPKKHHGIYVNTKNDINDIRFEYNKSGGFFERVVYTLSMLGYPSSFSSFIPYINKKNQRTLFSQKTDVSISNTHSISLDKLVKHDFLEDLQKFSYQLDMGNIGTQRYAKTSVILRDFILIFVSSAIARYNPVLWRRIYSGEYSKLILYFEKSFNNINDMIRLVNDIIMQGEQGKLIINFREHWAKDFME